MLQQTQVATVTAYFSRFMQRFPDIAALAAADEDAVLALWAGLGYYSRARNLWRCACRIVNEHGGVFPRTAEALAQLPGIGPSTAAAIASICFNERISILDANAQRVLTRVLCFRQPLKKAAIKRELQHCANALLPTTTQHPDGSLNMQAYTQALMDLGAGICTSTAPQCAQCPANDLCLAQAHALQTELPVKARPAVRKTATWHFVWLEHDNAILLTQRSSHSSSPNRIWSGLWCFPQLSAATHLEHFLHTCSKQAVYTMKHELTHKKLLLQVSRLSVPDKAQAEALLNRTSQDDTNNGSNNSLGNNHCAAHRRLKWANAQELKRLGLPAPISKMLQERCHWHYSDTH